jgi:hypothetical protein
VETPIPDSAGRSGGTPASPDGPALTDAPGRPPSTRRIRLAAVDPAKAELRRFGGGLLNRDDPLDGAGILVETCSFSHIYPVDPDNHPRVIRDLFENVYGHVKDNRIAGSEAALVDFDDARTGQREPSRRYIVIDRATTRGTKLSTFATFRGYGDYLYVSVESYLLPPLSWFPVLAAGFVLLVSMLELLAFFYFDATNYISNYISILTEMLPAIIVLWLHRDVVRSLRAGDSLAMALRRRHFRVNRNGTFNSDDIRMHFKSTAFLIIEAMQGVFEKNGISPELLERVREGINMSTNIHVSGGILNVLGNLVGGGGNVAGRG